VLSVEKKFRPNLLLVGLLAKEGCKVEMAAKLGWRLAVSKLGSSEDRMMSGGGGESKHWNWIAHAKVFLVIFGDYEELQSPKGQLDYNLQLAISKLVI
jgi:hypothetical protein